MNGGRSSYFLWWLRFWLPNPSGLFILHFLFSFSSWGIDVVVVTNFVFFFVIGFVFSYRGIGLFPLPFRQRMPLPSCDGSFLRRRILLFRFSTLLCRPLQSCKRIIHLASPACTRTSF